MCDEDVSENRFLADRMLGPLTRYLRFMGYDTRSANSLSPGDPLEDTRLLDQAGQDHRILLTRDHELARRGGNRAVFVNEGDVLMQVRQLSELGLISLRLPMSRCSLCNSPLCEATHEQITEASYAPSQQDDLMFFWCEHCKKLYWNGSHVKHLRELIGFGT